MGGFAINFVTARVVAFVLFLRRLVLLASPLPLASLSELGGRCGGVAVTSELRRRAAIPHPRLLGVVGALLVKIRQDPSHHEERRVVFDEGLPQLLAAAAGRRVLRLRLPVPFGCVDDRATGHGNKALCCKVIHRRSEAGPSASRRRSTEPQYQNNKGKEK